MDRLQILEGLLNELLQGIQSVIQSGEELSDEFQGLLAQELGYLTEEIDQIRAEQQVSALPPLEDSMPSSNISQFAYDPKNQRMFIRFLGKHPNRMGHVYAYENVPPVVFSLFRNGAVPAKTDGRNRWGAWWKGKSPSMGASMNVLLKQAGFPYARMT